VAGYVGGRIDEVLMRIIDAIIAFPNLVLALVFVAVFGATIQNVMLAIGINSVPAYARLVRSQVLSLRTRDFVLAAHAQGASVWRILLLHLLPNAMAPVIVAATLGMSFAILAEASLSFLGVGVRPPTPTWGGMLNESFRFIYGSGWLSIFPGLAIFLLVLALNFLGDALRDVLDPRTSRSLGME
jgi:peptide/nickel transport system permease protein